MANITVTTSAYPQQKDITVVSVKGFIDTTTAPEFEKAFQSVLGANKFSLIIDLKETTYISSVGWGIFVGEIKRIRNQKGNLFLVAMSPEVTEAYELLEFDTILKSFPTVDQAVQNGFGRSRAKGGEKAQADQGLENPPAEKGFDNTGLNKSIEEPQINKAPRKPHWVARILLPWNWF